MGDELEDDKTIRLWDIDTEAAKGPALAAHTDQVLTVAFSSDGQTLASGSSGNTILLWDVATGATKGRPLVATS